MLNATFDGAKVAFEKNYSFSKKTRGQEREGSLVDSRDEMPAAPSTHLSSIKTVKEKVNAKFSARC